MIILPPAHGFLRGRVFYPIQTRVEPQSNLILPGFLLLNNPALLGAQATLAANVYNMAARAFLFPTIGLTANAIPVMSNVGQFGVTAGLTADAATLPLNRTTTYNTAGTYNYVIPTSAIDVNVYLAGAGGGGGSPAGGTAQDGSGGGATTLSFPPGSISLTAWGGYGGAQGAVGGVVRGGGTGGTANGGNQGNVTGSNGALPGTVQAGPPGPAGGTDGMGLGISGGAGGSQTSISWQGGGGGGPGALRYDFINVTSVRGQTVTITVGAHGVGGHGLNGNGADGMDGIAILTWR